MKVRILIVLALAVLAGCQGTGKGDRVTQAFLDAFPTPSARDFIAAVQHGQQDRALQLARLAPGGLNTEGSKGETALLAAVLRGDIRMVEVLLRAGANPNGGKDGSPLHPAVRAEDTRMLTMLLAAGADPNLTYNGEPPLAEAGLKGNLEAARLLLAKGANAEQVDRIGQVPILRAAATDHWLVVQLLLANGASIWTVPKNGFSVAIYASTSRIRPDTPDGQALDYIKQGIKASGYPDPPPGPPEVRAMLEAGKWPPKPVFPAQAQPH